MKKILIFVFLTISMATFAGETDFLGTWKDGDGMTITIEKGISGIIIYVNNKIRIGYFAHDVIHIPDHNSFLGSIIAITKDGRLVTKKGFFIREY